MRRFVHGMVSLCSLAAIAACGPSHLSGDANGGDDGGGGADANHQPHTLTTIVVTPTNPIIELDLGTTTSQDFVATGQYLDGVPEDLTGQVTWTVENPAVGSMTGATLNIPSFAAVTVEVSKITASFSGIDGQAQITIAAYRRTGPTQDFFFILPYVDPSGPANKPLDFSTAIPSMDTFFLMDATGSMGGVITNLKNSLTSTIIPGIQAAVPSTQFGAGTYRDFPISPFGDPTDQPFNLLQAITPTASSVQSAVNTMTATGGNDWPEGGIEAIYQVATGEGITNPSPTNVPANHSGVGGVGYRSEVMPVVVAMGDALPHATSEPDPGCAFGPPAYTGTVASFAHTRQQTKDALGAVCARVVGVAASTLNNACSPQYAYEDLATTTGARVPPEAWDVPSRPAGCPAGQCCTNLNGTGRAPDAMGLCPLVFIADSSGSGLGNTLVTGIQMLTRFATFSVTSEKQGVTTDIDGNPLPGAYTTADFIKAITPVSFMLPPPPPTLPNPTFDTMSFFGVTPGTQVEFGVNAFNDFVPQTEEAQIFRATIRVLAGGCTPLDQREVVILVPPTPIIVE